MFVSLICAVLQINYKLNFKVFYSQATETVTNVYVFKKDKASAEIQIPEKIPVKKQLRKLAFRHALFDVFSISGYLKKFLVRQCTHRTRMDLNPP